MLGLRQRWAGAAAIAVLALVVGCGGGEKAGEQAEAPPAAGSDLTPFEVENGIGPVKEALVLGEIDKPLAEKGKAVYEAKCTACHKMDTLYVGPALGEVTTRRTGAFVMNMILNPQEMVERHPVARQMLAERMTFMANQNLTVDEARAVLEYLRTQAKSTPKS